MPPGYQQSKPRTKKKSEAYVGRIEQILKADQALPRKQRHTAKRIWERLKGEGFTGGYGQINALHPSPVPLYRLRDKA
ncbi:MAG: hypothetical protein ABSF95_00120 [Verrucomicrobiota bacterium]